MTAARDGLLGVHAKAFNGKDLETVESLVAPHARCIRDGRWVGEGPAAARQLILEEYGRSEEVVAQVLDLDGDAIVVEWAGAEGRRQPVGVLRLQGEDRATELRLDRDEAMVRRLVSSAKPREWVPAGPPR